MAPRRSRSQQRALRERAAAQRVDGDPARAQVADSGAAAKPRPRSSGSYRPAARRSFWAGPYPYLAFLGAIVVVVLVLVAVGHFSTSAPTPTTGNQNAVELASSIPASMFNQVGLGPVEKSSEPLTALPSSAPSLKGSDGKPEFLYVGAEWCPYCAAERWVMLAAVSRFGSISGLTLTSSSSSDVYPNTPTFSFAKITYRSQYLDFVPVETQDRNHNTLQTPTAQQQSLETKYAPNGIPFLYLAGRYTQSGASYSPGDLAGLSQGQIAHDLQSDPSSTPAKDILGNANLLAAAICETTGGQPSTVCQSPGVQAGETVL